MRRKSMRKRINESELDLSTKVTLIVNAIYFDTDEYLSSLIKSTFKSKDDLPDRSLVVAELVNDKGVSEDDASSMYTSFIDKYFKED